jgi:UDP-glucose 4-epimerase
LNALVTGGSGFIGSNLCEHLARDGNSVTCFDNLSAGKYAYVKSLRRRKAFRFVRGDILDRRLLDKVVNGKDVVFHLAASADIRRSTKSTRLDLRQNTIGTWKVLEAMRRNDVSTIVFSSSSAVYGEVESNRPLQESFGPLCPISLYGASKLADEGMVTAYCHLYGFSGLMYRFANIVGRNQHRGVIVDFLMKLRHNSGSLEVLGDGRQLKSYTDVDDCVEGIVHGFANFSRKGSWEVYNIGTVDAITADRVAKIVIGELGLKRVQINHKGGVRGWPGDTRKCVLSIQKLKRTGWRPKRSSEDAVRRTTRLLRKVYFD